MSTPFTVKNGEDKDYNTDKNLWIVEMYHQCDAWQITDEEYGREKFTHEEAVKLMEEFVKHAQEALQMLKDKKTIEDY